MSAASLDDEMWARRSATDPLGRSPEVLRALWAARTPLRAPSDTGTTLGYADAAVDPPPDVVTIVSDEVLAKLAALNAEIDARMASS